MLDIVHNARRKASAPEVICVERNTIQKRSENPKEQERVRDRPALRDGIPWKEEPRQENISIKENGPTCFALFLERDCPKGNTCDYWHPLSVPFTKRGL